MSTWILAEQTVPVLPAADRDLSFASDQPTGFTFSRSTPALSRGPTGRWTSYSANVLRPYYDPITLVYQGRLIEPERAQLVFNSRVPGLTQVNATLLEDATVQTPFGLGAIRITPNTATAVHGADFYFSPERGSTIGDNAFVAFRITFKLVGAYSRLSFHLLSRDNVYHPVTVQATGSGVVLSSAITSARIEPDTDGFYTVHLATNLGSGGFTPACNISFAINDSGDRTFAGDGNSYALIAYYGAEIGTETTSPILSSGTVTQRAADVLRGTASFVGQGGKAFAIDYTPRSDSGTVLHLSGVDDIRLYNAPGVSGFQASVAGAVQTALTSPSSSSRRTVTASMANASFILAQDGVLGGVSASGISPSLFASMAFGSNTDGTNPLPMILRRVKYWNESLTIDAATEFSRDIATQGVGEVLPVLEIQPEITIGGTSTSFTLTVLLSGEPTGATFQYRTLPGTALEGIDYVGINTSRTIEPGQFEAVLTFSLLTRSTTEDKTYTVEILNARGASLLTTTCVVHLNRIIPVGNAATTQRVFADTLPAGFSLSRASSAWRRDSDGVWKEANSNAYRYHFTAPGVAGLLVEGGPAQQLLFDSVDPGWVATGSTRTLNTTAQTPTGTRSLAWRMSAALEGHAISFDAVSTKSAPPSGEVTAWMIIRPLNWSYFRLDVRGVDNIIRRISFDFTGTGSVTSSDPSVITHLQQDLFLPQWFRIGMILSMGPSQGVNFQMRFLAIEASGLESPQGSTTAGADICHVQVSPGAGVSSPIIVAGATSATTRAADILKGDDILLGRTSYTLGMRFLRLRNEPAAAQRLWTARNSTSQTTNDDIGVLAENNVLVGRFRTGGTTHPAITGPANAVGSLATALVTVGATSKIALFAGGAKVGEQIVGSGGIPSPVNTLRIGANEPDGINPSALLLQAVYAWTAPLSDADATLYSANLDYTPPASSALPIVSIPAAATIAEGSALAVTVTKSGTGACTVQIETKSHGSATWDTDFTGLPPTPVSFAAGETSKVVTVQTAADAGTEGVESFNFRLTQPSGCTLGNALTVATITEPEPTGALTAATGFASAALCGTGQPIYRVTTLADSGAGSLRAGIVQGNAMIVFEVAGRIQLLSNLIFTASNITIAGETAPAPGITIQRGEFVIQASNIRISHITFERGYDASNVSTSEVGKVFPGDTATPPDTIRSNIHFQHCAFFWGLNALVSNWPSNGSLTNVSYHDCIFAEPLHLPSNYDSSLRNHLAVQSGAQKTHAHGVLIGHNSRSIDLQHCLFQDSALRNPLIDHGTELVLANNVANNCGGGAVVQQSYTAPLTYTLTCRGYLTISGPDTPDEEAFSPFRFDSFRNPQPANSKAFVSDLYGWKGGTSSSPFRLPGTVVTYSTAEGRPYWLASSGEKVFVEIAAPVLDVPGGSLTARQIYDRAVRNAGPRPKEIRNTALSGNTSVRRTVARLRAKTGKWVNHENEVGGFYSPNTTVRALDGTTTFANGAVIPPVPSQPQPSTSVSRQAITDWLRLHQTQLQDD